MSVLTLVRETLLLCVCIVRVHCACRIMCEAQRFLLHRTDVPIHLSLHEWLSSSRVGWVCICDIRDFEAVLADTQHAADASSKR